MKVNFLGLAVVSVVLLPLVHGCAAVEDRAVIAPQKIVANVSKPKVNKKDVEVDIENGKCTATFTEDPDGRVRRNTLRVTQGNCTTGPETTQPPTVTIDGKNALLIDLPTQFITEGSCRYCYLNSSGGMSCIIMPSC